MTSDTRPDVFSFLRLSPDNRFDVSGYFPTSLEGIKSQLGRRPDGYANKFSSFLRSCSPQGTTEPVLFQVEKAQSLPGTLMGATQPVAQWIDGRRFPKEKTDRNLSRHAITAQLLI